MYVKYNCLMDLYILHINCHVNLCHIFRNDFLEASFFGTVYGAAAVRGRSLQVGQWRAAAV